MYQALDDRFTEVTAMGELSLGRPRGGRGRFDWGLISHHRILVTGLLIEGGRLIGGRLMEVQLSTLDL